MTIYERGKGRIIDKEEGNKIKGINNKWKGGREKNR